MFLLNCTTRFQLISLDFAIDLAIFTMWLQTYGLIDGQTDRENNWRTDQRTDEHVFYVHRHAKNYDFPMDLAIFTKALPTNGLTDRPTDRPTDHGTLWALFMGSHPQLWGVKSRFLSKTTHPGIFA